MSLRRRRVLWDASESETEATNQSNGGDARSTTYHTVFAEYSSKPEPKPLFELISNSLVIVQELSLTCYLLARHRIAILEDRNHTNKSAEMKSSLAFFQNNL